MRRKDREVTEISEILSIVDRAEILHLGLSDEGCPYIVPLHFGYEYSDGKLVFYVHSAKEGRKLELIRSHPEVCVELDCGAKLLSGGDVPCLYGAAFSSVIGRGRAQILGDAAEKAKALRLLMKNQTGRDFDITGEMTRSVEVIRITVPEFTAKARRE